jgi:DNA-binding beta-propeller fold protein YncE
MRINPLFVGGAAVLSLLMLGGGLGSHRWAEAHVAYYTGDEARTTSCVLCHFSARGGTLVDRLLKPRYRSPLDIAVCRDGHRIYATAQDGGALLEIDPESRRLVKEIAVGRRPNSVALDANCSVAYVSNQDDDSISVVDLHRGEAVSTLPSGRGPAGLALSLDGKTLFVANSRGADISVVDIEGGAERVRLAGGSYPYGVALSPDGTRVLIDNQLAQPARAPAEPFSEVTVLDTRRDRIETRIFLRGAHLLEGMAFSPAGDMAFVVLVRPRNLIPVLQVERGWMMTDGLAVIDLASGRSVQLPLDDVDEFFADPSDVAVTPDGRYAFVSHGGVDTVSVLDLAAVRDLLRGSSDAQIAGIANRLGESRRYIVKRIHTGSNPRGLAVSADGTKIYIAERLDDRIGIIDIGPLERVADIDLEGPRHETLVRRGEKIFNSAGYTLQRQFSCRSCHPENHMDRLQYDFEPDGLGRNVVDNKTMLGLKATGPFKWNGKNTSLYMQCGIRFARFLMRREPFPIEDLNALVAFLDSLQPPPNEQPTTDAGLAAARERGRQIFERAAKRDGTQIPQKNRCITCHPPPLFTDLRVSDVGSASPIDNEKGFDTPGLSNLILSSPYLHDGKAMTLEEIWTLYSPDDTHGVTSDLGKDGLNDLIEYLKTF